MANSLESTISSLVVNFLRNPLGYFHERELHCDFYGIARDAMGTEVTKDGNRVHLLRYEYNSFWRYRGEDGYAEVSDDLGMPLSLDFALLNRLFVKSQPHLVVVNKDEQQRRVVRDDLDMDNRCSPAIDAGIEFKMAHLATRTNIMQGQVNGLESLMLKDCRKLAHERVKVGYAIGFSHGPLPNTDQTESIGQKCLQEYEKYFPCGDLRVLLVSPQLVKVFGNWDETMPTIETSAIKLTESSAESCPAPPAPPERGMEYTIGLEGQRVCVCCVGDVNSRVFKSDRTGESFLVNNDVLVPVNDPRSLLTDLAAGDECLYDNNEYVFKVSVINKGPCNSRVKAIGKDESFLAANHQLSKLSGNELLDLPIRRLQLPVQSRKCMARLGLTTIGELAKASIGNLKTCKNVGDIELDEIKRKMANLGLFITD